MPKNVFWPAAITVMGFTILADRAGLLPQAFSFLWPLILVIVGLGGIITSDRKEWLKEIKKKK